MQLACFSKAVNMSRTVKNSEIQTALFSKRSTVPSWKHANRYIFKNSYSWSRQKLKRLFSFVVSFCDVTCNPRIAWQATSSNLHHSHLIKDVRAQNVPTYRFFLNLPRRKVMIYFCQKGKKNGGSPCSFSRSWGAFLEDCVTLRRS